MRPARENSKLSRHIPGGGPSPINATMIRNLTETLLGEIQQQLADKGTLIPARELQIALQALLARANLVTREEFDAQAAVLVRTRAKLEELERQLAQLEKQATI
jgi:ubiquinone biosynthesis accessory factor UbiK